MHGLMSYRCSEGFNRYTATELRLEPGCYVATELWLELGRYVATERDDLSVATDQAFARAWSLHSDRAGRSLPTELRLELGHYVATERDEVAMYGRASARARSLRSDRAGLSFGGYVANELWLELGRYVATELWLGLGCYAATGQRVCVVTTLRSSLVCLV
ncbi:hypothetical protein DY000_02033944 [Brassica cretica]|uniref:Uncharacterized protein n=1 Tax=Brassica cretica TaxID=69181 RepID=A0ABQ7DJQ1_BRACR|nr:hypothetical protein DY000_02033944 [Brassica cretica]